MNGNREYDEQMARKIQAYKNACIEGIYLTESCLSGHWQEGILDRIERSLEVKSHKINAAKNKGRPIRIRA